MSGLHQFTAVAIEGRALLIAGAPGSGKSSLALALIDRGAMLIGDDGVALVAEGAALIARPAPATRGLIEVRGVGLVTMPECAAAPVALLVHLDAAAPRFIERAGRELVCGIALPAVSLWPGSPVIALRAEWAMRVHGLPRKPGHQPIRPLRG